jgi:HAMP domain-containing protein
MRAVGADLPTLAILFVVLALLLVIMKWTFRPARPRTGRPVDAADSADLGMLDVVVADIPRDEAMLLRAKLGEAGIRTSMSRRRNGDMDVLVFKEDADQAREVLAL